MNPWLVVGLSVAYIGVLFLLAWKSQGWSIWNKPGISAWIYPLSMGVYCTAWTFYGSIGKASRDGLEFLPVYIGPTLTAPLWWIVLRKMIRISQVQRTSTIADFISSRYGKSVSVAGIVTVMCFLGIIPYISLQLKAISESFDLITEGGFKTGSVDWLHNTALYVALFMAAFTILFGARKNEAFEKHGGIVAAVAFESVIKLLAFLIAGLVIIYGLFGGMGPLFEAGFFHPEIRKNFTLPEANGMGEWFWVSSLSALAIVLLPRQFHVAVVENAEEEHVRKAMWVFPTYLFLINLFVLPLAVAGLLTFGSGNFDPDYFILELPMHFQMPGLALLVFIGGISAATSMIIVETLALSTMFTNHLLFPLLVGVESIQDKIGPRVPAIGLWSRRIAIVAVLVLSYLYYLNLSQVYSLVSIGLISFVSVAQFGPALLGGMFWKKGTRAGALSGILVGFALWLYTLMLPTVISHTGAGKEWLELGLFGQSWLRPNSLFGLEGFSPITHGFFWSLFFNILAYIVVSLNTEQDVLEKNQSEVFVDIFQYSAVYERTVVLKGKASLPDLEALLSRFFGEERSRQVIRLFAKKHQIDISDPGKPADHRIIAYTERLLAGVMGSASARMMVSSIVAEEEIRLDEVVQILKESQQILSTNRELVRKSAELKTALEDLASANFRLKQNDRLKDDFLSTVTHELRTPITSIRAFSEILFDNPDIEAEDRQHYLGIVIKETERLSRLISQVLDLERYESGRQKLSLSRIQPEELVEEALEAMDQLLKEKQVRVDTDLKVVEGELVADRDKILQVLLNLLSNALKFVEPESGKIQIRGQVIDTDYVWEVQDNGKGISTEYQQLIFEKFFQARNQLTRKPKGTGLGLAICRKILEIHNGHIEVESSPGQGSTFRFRIPLWNPTQEQLLTRESEHTDTE